MFLKSKGCQVSAALAWRLDLGVVLLIRFKLHSSFHTTSIQWVGHYDLVCGLTLDSHFYHFDEGLVDLHAVLGRRLEVLHVVIFLAPAFSFLGTDLALWLAVYLVAYQHERETLGIVGSGILNKAILPFVQGLEARRVRQIVAKCTAIGASVEREA